MIVYQDHWLRTAQRIYGGFFPFGICQEIYDTVLVDIDNCVVDRQ